MRRRSFAIEIVFGAAMVRPFSNGAERDASALRLVGRSRSPWLNRGLCHGGCQEDGEIMPAWDIYCIQPETAAGRVPKHGPNRCSLNLRGKRERQMTVVGYARVSSVGQSL